jgi:hypothetical protein
VVLRQHLALAAVVLACLLRGRGDGGWAMGDGRWAMGDGRWAMGDGLWAMGRFDVIPKDEERWCGAVRSQVDEDRLIALRDGDVGGMFAKPACTWSHTLTRQVPRPLAQELIRRVNPSPDFMIITSRYRRQFTQSLKSQIERHIVWVLQLPKCSDFESESSGAHQGS